MRRLASNKVSLLPFDDQKRTPHVRREIGRRAIAGVRYFNSRFPTLGIEPLTLSDLFTRVPAGHFARPQRPAFHLLMLFSSGTTTHYLDFERLQCSARTLVHVRPGQVQQFMPGARAQARILLFTPEFVLPDENVVHSQMLGSVLERAAPNGLLKLDVDSFASVQSGLATIGDEYRRTDGSSVSARILQHLLYALLLRIAYCSDRGEAPSISNYRHIVRRFLADVETGFAQSRRVEDYATRLHYSTKALRRACLEVRGLPPKVIIENRVILEAKRLLAHTSWPVDSIAATVGFADATNFVKFFRQHANVTPSEFRKRVSNARR